MKKLLVILLAVLMLFGVFAASASAAGISFTDVKPSDWFYNDVKNAVNMGLVNGKSATIYAPDDNLTYAEAVKLAACMHERYTTGSVTQTNSPPPGNWYDSYVAYAKSNGIVSSNFNWEATATRAGYMSIFAHALPDSALQAINNVPDNTIPDVTIGSYYGKDIYKLYRAGIVQGVDAKYNCNPGSNIKRSEVAAILTRMMDSSARKSFSTVPGELLGLAAQPKDAATTVGGDASFSVKASGGTPPYKYEWHRIVANNGNNDVVLDADEGLITGTQTGTLTTKQCKDTENGDKYYCIVSDSAGGFIVSEKATLTVNAAALTVTKQPKSQTVNKGDNASFSVTVSGGKEPYKYQWYKIYPGQTTATILTAWPYENATTATMTSVNNLPEYDDGAKFFCVITDADNNQVISNKATLTVKSADLTATAKINGSSTVSPGGSVSLSVTASGGTPPYTYRWVHKAGTDVFTYAGSSYGSVNSANLNYTVPDVPTVSLGSRPIYCEVTDNTGKKVNSNTVYINVQKKVVTKTANKSGKVGEPIKTDYKFANWNIPAGSTTYDPKVSTMTNYGLHVSYTSSVATLYGTPTKAGKALLRMIIETDSTIYHFDLTVNIDP